MFSHFELNSFLFIPWTSKSASRSPDSLPFPKPQRTVYYPAVSHFLIYPSHIASPLPMSIVQSQRSRGQPRPNEVPDFALTTLWLRYCLFFLRWPCSYPNSPNSLPATLVSSAPTCELAQGLASTFCSSLPTIQCCFFNPGCIFKSLGEDI